MLERGHIATMYHRGTDSYAEVVVLRPVSKEEVQAVLDHISGDAPVQQPKALPIKAKILAPVPAFTAPKVAKTGETDGEIFRRVLREVVGKLPHTIYSGLNVDKTKRRIKAYCFNIGPIYMARLQARYAEEYGDRFIECDRTAEFNGGYGGPCGGDMFVRVKVAK